MDEEVAASPAPPADPKDERARGIFTKWRNTHLNHLPVEFFNRIEAESEHLIALIRAEL